jgi:hypothetical protein
MSMHQSLSCFLAQADAGPVLPEPLHSSSSHQTFVNPEFMLVLGLAAALTAAVFVWALVIRKRRPTDPHVRALEPARASASGTDDGHGRHRHRRRRHRSNGSRERRNPTLQETGGLPPPRPEDELPKS